jgi:hypothetical protein
MHAIYAAAALGAIKCKDYQSAKQWLWLSWRCNPDRLTRLDTLKIIADINREVRS